MAANLTNHDEITVVQTTTNTTEQTLSINEKAGQTFKKGTPVMLAAGVVQAWDGTTVAKGILGITDIDASNLATDGAGAPGPFIGVGFPGTSTTFGAVPFEASAVNIPRGAPFSTGQTLVAAATQETIFRVQVDNNNFSGGGSATPLQADIGVQYGLTVDASGHWYLDKAKVTVGTNTVMTVVQIDPITGSIVNGAVYAKFSGAASQYNQTL
jgi:hypothetical protein